MIRLAAEPEWRTYDPAGLGRRTDRRRALTDSREAVSAPAHVQARRPATRSSSGNMRFRTGRPERRVSPEILVEVPELPRMMDPVKMIVAEYVSQRTDVHIHRRMDEILMGADHDDHEPGDRATVDFQKKRRRYSCGEVLQKVVGEVMIAADGAHLGNRVMNPMETPQQRNSVLSAMKPVVEDVSDESSRQGQRDPTDDADRKVG